jgi:hypothetical protein
MLLNFGTPKLCIQARNASFHIFTYTRLAKCSVTVICIILGQMEENGFFTSLVRRNSAFMLKHKFSSFYIPKDSEVL